MAYIDFMSVVHKSTKRDYLARVNDPEYPKAKAAELAKRWDYDYWDGDRRINYGGYRYMEGRWEKVARAMAEHYGIKPGDKILDVGCGKGFLLFDFTKVVSGLDIHGIDVSSYAIENAKDEVKQRLQVGNANSLPFPDNHFQIACVAFGLRNVTNTDQGIAEMCRVTRPGGKVFGDVAVLNTYGLHVLSLSFCASGCMPSACIPR